MRRAEENLAVVVLEGGVLKGDGGAKFNKLRPVFAVGRGKKSKIVANAGRLVACGVVVAKIILAVQLSENGFTACAV